jgi:hypothetical protein
VSQDVEITSFDMRYESYRMKHAGEEKALVASIVEHGIREPLQGVDSGEVRILLNGFKRYRCARKLGLAMVPYVSLGCDEAFGIIQLIRIANSRSLSMLEQAKLIDELRSVHAMSVPEIARLLERSNGWVSMRIGILREMSSCVMDKIFSGEFPVYAYMYTLRRFIRMNGAGQKDVDEFVGAVAGKHLSIRDIERLAHGYFRGSNELREQIKKGDIRWGLNLLKQPARYDDGCTDAERKTLRDLEVTQEYMQRITSVVKDGRCGSNAFYAQAHLLAGGILRCLDLFSTAIKEFHDRSGQTQSDRHPS